ncbi:uncharacterized protein STEHIDRAFT_116862, partial [Stereum hirsutum FP-91666 SS1]
MLDYQKPAENIFALSKLPVLDLDWGNSTASVNKLCIKPRSVPVSVWIVGIIDTLWLFNPRSGEPEARISVGVAPLADHALMVARNVLCDFSRPVSTSTKSLFHVNASKWTSTQVHGERANQNQEFEKVYDARNKFATKHKMPRLAPEELKKGDLVLMEAQISRYNTKKDRDGKVRTKTNKADMVEYKVSFDLVAVSLLEVGPKVTEDAAAELDSDDEEMQALFVFGFSIYVTSSPSPFLLDVIELQRLLNMNFVSYWSSPLGVFQSRVAPSPIGPSKFGSLRRLTQQFEFCFCSCVDDYLPSLTRPPLCLMSAVTESVSVAALPERSDDSAGLTPFQEMISLFQGLDIFEEGGAHSKQLLDHRRFVLFPLRATKVWHWYKEAEHGFWTAESVVGPIAYEPNKESRSIAGCVAAAAMFLSPISTLHTASSSISSAVDLPEARSFLGLHSAQAAISSETLEYFL